MVEFTTVGLGRGGPKLVKNHYFIKENLYYV